MSVGSEQAVLVVHVVIGDLLTLQIPTSVIEINESGRIQFSGRTIVHVSEPMDGINSLLEGKCRRQSGFTPDIRTICTNAAMIAQAYIRDWRLATSDYLGPSLPLRACTSAAA